jgi:hypothetical protein
MQAEPFTKEMLTRKGWMGLVEIDPDAARTLLGLNDENRKLRQNRTKQYAEAMAAHSWYLSADAVAVEKGRLQNGQHRCKAVILSETTITVALMVNMGVAFDVLDNGAPRSPGDVLFLAGLSDNADALAKAARLYLAEAEVSTSVRRSDNQFIEKWVVDNADMEAWVTWAMGIRQTSRTSLAGMVVVPAAVLGFAVESARTNNLVPPPKASGGHRPTASIRPHASGLDRTPDVDDLRAFLHTIMTRTGVEAGSVEDLLTGRLESWRDRARIDRRTSIPQGKDVLRMLTWGIDQITTDLHPKKFKMPTGRWLWAPSALVDPA